MPGPTIAMRGRGRYRRENEGGTAGFGKQYHQQTYLMRMRSRPPHCSYLLVCFLIRWDTPSYRRYPFLEEPGPVFLWKLLEYSSLLWSSALSASTSSSSCLHEGETGHLHSCFEISALNWSLSGDSWHGQSWLHHPKYCLRRRQVGYHTSKNNLSKGFSYFLMNSPNAE